MPMPGLSTTNAGTFDRSISEMPPELSEHPLWMSARHHFTNPLAALRSPKLFYAMEVNINGKATQTTAGNLAELATEMGLPERGVAVAVDNKMVPRTEWTATSLCEGANIVIIKAAFGG